MLKGNVEEEEQWIFILFIRADFLAMMYCEKLLGNKVTRGWDSIYQYWYITILAKHVTYRDIETRNLWFPFVDVFLAYVSRHSKIGYLTSFSLSNQDVPGCKVAVNNLSNIIQGINESSKSVHGISCPSSSDHWFRALEDRGRFEMRDFILSDLRPQKNTLFWKNKLKILLFYQTYIESFTV